MKDFAHFIFNVHTAKAAIAVAGAIITLNQLLSLIARTPLYGRLNRKRHMRQRITKLATNVNLEYFESVLGKAAFTFPGEGYTRYIWLFADCVVGARIVDEKADGFVVVALNKRFRTPVPRFVFRRGHRRSVVLNKTRFVELSESPQRVYRWIGARRFGYEEHFYFGNPGHHQGYVFGLNDLGYTTQGDLHSMRTFNEISAPGVDNGDAGYDIVHDLAWARFRKSTIVNAVGVVAPYSTFGTNSLLRIVDLDEVRTLAFDVDLIAVTSQAPAGVS
jgi:hypothetical protein